LCFGEVRTLILVRSRAQQIGAGYKQNRKAAKAESTSTTTRHPKPKTQNPDSRITISTWANESAAKIDILCQRSAQIGTVFNA